MATKLTAGRLALLRAVQQRAVAWYEFSGDSYRDDVRPGRRCTDDIRLLEDAGLVFHPTREDEKPWALTDEGRQVLAEEG